MGGLMGRKFMAALLATTAAVASACGAASSSRAQSDHSRGDVYSLSATKRCLQRQGAKTTAVPRSDAQKQAFHDLAQRRSIEASIRSIRVDLAFTRAAPNAELLAELLSPPRGPYVVRVRKNAVVMYRTPLRPTASRMIACLR
jgi:hypothetical protein